MKKNTREKLGRILNVLDKNLENVRKIEKGTEKFKISTIDKVIILVMCSMLLIGMIIINVFNNLIIARLSLTIVFLTLVGFCTYIYYKKIKKRFEIEDMLKKESKELRENIYKIILEDTIKKAN